MIPERIGPAIETTSGIPIFSALSTLSAGRLPELTRIHLEKMTSD